MGLWGVGRGGLICQGQGSLEPLCLEPPPQPQKDMNEGKPQNQRAKF